jgi:hypothetical protein
MSLVKQALTVAKKYPVFPTNNKKPALSNKWLGVGRGEGGYKIATQDPALIKKYFSHDNAKEIAVPMGAMSSLMAVDVDLYKDPSLQEWIEDNWIYLGNTMCHDTRSGGRHFFFKHPGDSIRFPSTLRPGVDIKAVGTGYVCFPPTQGYSARNAFTPKSFPMKLLEEAMKQRGGTGKFTVGSAFNDASDGELIACIQQADELYPALRTLSYRMPGRKGDDGSSYTKEQMINILQNIMDSSVASDPQHPRHEDWGDRRLKIEELVVSAMEKHARPAMDQEAAAIWADTNSFVDTQKMIAAASRPIGPQRETKPEHIEALVGDIEEVIFETMTAQSLHKERLPPIKWLVPGMIPCGSTISLGGTSNVGKTRWLAAIAALGAAGDLDLMGLPKAAPFSTLLICNEERIDDLKRRIKSVLLQHGIKKSKEISVRGKDSGMLRLVALNERGNLEIDEANVALIVVEARRLGADLIVFDPYVTLSDAASENDAASAAVLTKAFILLSSMTGSAVCHMHHTPKDRSKDNDWYRGDNSAWRGSSAIYSALDCGYTLSHWMPKGKEQRKAWKSNYLDQKLSRWIVLDTGKIREGQPLDPVVYELVGQPTEAGEVGVCRLSSEAEANNVLISGAVGQMAGDSIAKTMIDNLGYDEHDSMTKVHKLMKGTEGWPDISKTPGKLTLLGWFGDPFNTSEGTVQVTNPGKGSWIISIKEKVRR